MSAEAKSAAEKRKIGFIIVKVSTFFRFLPELFISLVPGAEKVGRQGRQNGKRAQEEYPWKKTSTLQPGSHFVS